MMTEKVKQIPKPPKVVNAGKPTEKQPIQKGSGKIDEPRRMEVLFPLQ